MTPPPKKKKKNWNDINKIFPIKSETTQEITLYSDDGFVDSNKTADYMNEFFSSIGSKLAQNFDREWMMVIWWLIYTCI